MSENQLHNAESPANIKKTAEKLGIGTKNSQQGINALAKMVNEKDADGLTPLQVLLRDKNPETAKALLDLVTVCNGIAGGNHYQTNDKQPLRVTVEGIDGLLAASKDMDMSLALVKAGAAPAAGERNILFNAQKPGDIKAAVETLFPRATKDTMTLAGELINDSRNSKPLLDTLPPEASNMLLGQIQKLNAAAQANGLEKVSIAHINVLDASGKTALGRANSTELAIKLMQLGADPDAKQEGGKSQLDILMEKPGIAKKNKRDLLDAAEEFRMKNASKNGEQEASVQRPPATPMSKNPDKSLSM